YFLSLLCAIALAASLCTSSAVAAETRQFTATAVSATEVNFTWTRGERDYVYWIRRTGPDGKTFSVGVTDRSFYADRALEPDTAYTYTLLVTKSAGYQDEVLTAAVHTPGWQSQDIGF